MGLRSHMSPSGGYLVPVRVRVRARKRGGRPRTAQKSGSLEQLVCNAAGSRCRRANQQAGRPARAVSAKLTVCKIQSNAGQPAPAASWTQKGQQQLKDRLAPTGSGFVVAGAVVSPRLARAAELNGFCSGRCYLAPVCFASSWPGRSDFFEREPAESGSLAAKAFELQTRDSSVITRSGQLLLLWAAAAAAAVSGCQSVLEAHTKPDSSLLLAAIIAGDDWLLQASARRAFVAWKRVWPRRLWVRRLAG